MQDYFLHMYTSDDKTPQIETTIDKRKAPSNETERSPRNPNAVKKIKDEDPYPWRRTLGVI